MQISRRVAMSNFDANERVPFDGPHMYSSSRRRSDAPVMEVTTIPWPDFVNIPYKSNLEDKHFARFDH